MRGCGILDRVVGYAHQWHAAAWSIDTLPARLGITLASHVPAGGVLGMSVLSGTDRVILINDRIIGRRLERAVIGHEVAHLLTGSCGVELCRATGVISDTEALAWRGAARLCCSDVQLSAIHRGRASHQDVADDNQVPRALIEYADALYGVFDADTLADTRLRRARAMVNWMRSLQELSEQLRLAA